MKRISILIALMLFNITLFSQEEEKEQKNNLQVFTPSKLLNKGQWDIKWFNNLYTETKSNFDGKTLDKARENYFTSTLEVFTGVSETNRINVGAIIEFRSNTIGGRQALSVFSLEDTNTDRKNITSIAPSVKIQPFENIGNFSIQTAIHIPLIENETLDGVFLDETSWNFQNRFFYDYTFDRGKWQLFTELNTQYFFGETANDIFDAQGRKTTIDGSFASNTFLVTPGVFMSFFPTDEATVLGFVQHSQRFGDFIQDFTALGFGGKYQITEVLNLEILYSNFVRGNDSGLGQSFNLGLRALF